MDSSAPRHMGRRRFLAGTAAAAAAGGLLSYPALTRSRSGQAMAGSSQAAGPYQPTVESLSQHPLPQWYSDAKFGIFIHWGVYSVPAWAPVGQEYAEWYWSQMNNPSDPTHSHEETLYGADATYDQFIPQWKAEKFDPVAWVKLFERAGARYFVQVTKHHEGFALFNTAVSHRAAVYMGPRRDLVKELHDAARIHAPSLKRGTYYSLPEWYNPAYPGDGGSFPGGGPKQYITGAPLPYTGYLPVSDYVNDFQVPQLMELINQYDTDIMWGDIGGPNNSLPVMAYYYNHALNRRNPKEVVVNNRMGVDVWDFTTPEYASNFALTPQKWEACQGIDPFSFGYNSATPDSAYFTAEQLIQTLVDIVAKNGNFLLDIGPRADGTIRQVMVDRLTEIGDWLAINGEAIYGSAYWIQAADGNTRFTVTPGKFNMITLGWPGDQLVISAPVPLTADSKIRLLGSQAGPLAWSQQDGKTTITMPAAGESASRSQYAYTFSFDWNR